MSQHTDDAVTVDFTVFDVVTRRLLRTMRATEIVLIDLQCHDGEAWVFGHADPETHYVNEDGELAAIGDGGPLDPRQEITP